MKKVVTTRDNLVNEFNGKILLLPKEETSSELFYGGFRAFPYSGVCADLITLVPIRNLINSALMSLPESFCSNFPSNLKKKLRDFGKSIHNPRFAKQFVIKGELRIGCEKIQRWTNSDGNAFYFYPNDFELLWRGDHGIGKFSAALLGDNIVFVWEEFIKEFPVSVQEFLLQLISLNNHLQLDGKKYFIIKDFHHKMDACVAHYRIYSVSLNVQVLCKSGGDAVWKADVRLPGLEVFSHCPSELVESRQWETVKGEVINQHASFEEVVKELAGV